MGTKQIESHSRDSAGLEARGLGTGSRSSKNSVFDPEQVVSLSEPQIHL